MANRGYDVVVDVDEEVSKPRTHMVTQLTGFLFYIFLGFSIGTIKWS
jgi:hypothetical protein